jgi:hypothetical protein
VKARKCFYKYGPQKQAGVAILISDKADFKSKFVRKDKEDQFILIKGKIHEEEIIAVNTYAPNFINKYVWIYKQ